MNALSLCELFRVDWILYLIKIALTFDERQIKNAGQESDLSTRGKQLEFQTPILSARMQVSWSLAGGCARKLYKES